MRKVIDDSNQMLWLHNDERLELRAKCLLVIMKEFGSSLNDNGEPEHGARELYSACHDYVSHGNTEPEGVVKFYLDNREAYVL
jgi:hypothetical protein